MQFVKTADTGVQNKNLQIRNSSRAGRKKTSIKTLNDFVEENRQLDDPEVEEAAGYVFENDIRLTIFGHKQMNVVGGDHIIQDR